MLTGPKVFLEPPGVSELQPCTRAHLKKGLGPHSSDWWDIRQIPTSSQCSARIHFSQLHWLVHKSGWVCPGSPRHTSIGIFKPQGAVTRGFNTTWKGKVYHLVPEAHLFRRILMRPEAFLELPGMSGQQPCTRTNQK